MRPTRVCVVLEQHYNERSIDTRIDDMVRCDIGAFYVLTDPDNRATHLYPKYLSDEYINLLFYAFKKATEKGLYTWLYNEGAFPSGSACGLITEKYPDLKRTNELLQTRKLVFSDGSEGYFLFNQSGEVLCDAVEIKSDKKRYEVDLFNGDTYTVPYEKVGDCVRVSISLICGEGIFLYLTDESLDASAKPEWEKVCEITDIKSRISRIYKLDLKRVCETSTPKMSGRTASLSGMNHFREKQRTFASFPSSQKESTD